MGTGWDGKQCNLAFTMAGTAETWGTDFGSLTDKPTLAGDGVKSDTVPLFSLGTPSVEPVKTTDAAWQEYNMFTNVEPLEYSPEIMPQFNSSTALAHPWEEMLFMSLYELNSVSTKQTGNAYLHTPNVTGNGLADVTTRFGSWVARMKADDDSSEYYYRGVRSWMPTGFTISSQAGEPVKITFNGLGDKIIRDSTTDSGDLSDNWAATYLDTTRYMHHYHLCNSPDTNAGVWISKMAAVGAGSPNALEVGDRVSPSGVEITFNRNMSAIHTTCRYSDQPSPEDVGEITVKLTFPKMTDNFEDGNVDHGWAEALKDWESDTESYFQFRSRWSFGTVIDNSDYPYLEIGCPMLQPTSVTMDVEAGARTPLEVEFKALNPPNAADIATQFQYCGGVVGGGGACHDPIYAAIQNVTVPAILVADPA